MARTGRPISRFPAIQTAEIGGVSVGKHTLTAQAEQLASLTGRIGRRLNHWLKSHPDVPPTAEFLEAFRYYQAALLGLLREQRERARLSPGTEPLSDDEFERGMQELRTAILRSAETFTPEEWALVDRARSELEGKGVQ